MPIKHKISRSTLKIIEQLKVAGYQAYLVGGAVRDLILGREPKDHDISTNATPHQVKKVFGRRARIIGRRFKLVHVYSGKEIYEVSTFRRRPDLSERKGRETDSGLIVWRDNCYGTLEEDSTRRDFTVNAIYYDPLNCDPEIIDPVGGLADLKRGIIRMIGSPATRLEEDPVRSLRACKLVGQYGFKLESNLKKEIREMASLIALSSRVRLLEELHKIFKKPYSYRTLCTCYETGVLKYFLPSIYERWNSDPGIFCQKLLGIRDEKIQKRQISSSHLTGFSIMIIPFLEYEMGGDKGGKLWKDERETHTLFDSWIRQFFLPYKMPKNLIVRIRNIVRLQPRLLASKNPEKFSKHPDSRGARETFRIYAAAARRSTRFHSHVN